MHYKGKAVELIGQKSILGKEIAWIKILETGEFREVPLSDLDKKEQNFSMAQLHFTSIAAKIKDEIARKNILAPYESSLIPLPHQILVLEKVMQSNQTRFLLADEVGMGKTIETGLILKELQLRDQIKRVLVIVPKSAMMQWQSELKEHFNENFHIYDSELITSMARTFSNLNSDNEFNFWLQHDRMIVSTDALKPLENRRGWSEEKIAEYNKYRMEAVLQAEFDLIIIDEVHKMGGAHQGVSRYVLAQELCNTIPNALLLSATPHRGKSDHFRRILQLLDPDAFTGTGLPELKELEPYVIRTEKRLAVDYEGAKLFNERETVKLEIELDINNHQLQKELYKAVTDYVKKGFNSAKRTNNQAQGLFMILFQRIASSSTAAILSVMENRLYKLQHHEEYNEVEIAELSDSNYDEDTLDELNLDEIYNPSLGEFGDEEEYVSEIIEKAKYCLDNEVDAKLSFLLNFIRDLQNENDDPYLKMIIFTEFRATQIMLNNFLEKKGYDCTIINGQQDLDKRKESLHSFKTDKQILIATDAAGESLNMQFCHIVFNYDLPWNPMMLEQRIGRIDRIGQKRSVKAYNLLTNNSVDKRVYEVIVTKLDNILSELGIDKSSDVLDSTLDQKQVSKLYLQSLLDPDRFDYAENHWLDEIKQKLNNFHSTKNTLPKVKENEIDARKAKEIKQSPLPVWLEKLFKQYVILNGGNLQSNLLGVFDFTYKGVKKKITFDSEKALEDQSLTHITLQHDNVKKILSSLEEFDSKDIPVLKSGSGEETSGVWSLYYISAHNNIENEAVYQAFFTADNGKMYQAYANDLWNRFVVGEHDFKLVPNKSFKLEKNILLENQHINTFENLESKIIESMEKKYQNKLNAYKFKLSRIQKIGIENIKLSREKKLKDEHESWLSEFELNKKVIPGIKHLISVKIDE